MPSKVIVGMSGGVDSSVAAYLLCKQGLHVEGLFMKNWEEDDKEEYCAAAADLADAQSICNQLNIPLHTVNFSNEYWDIVFQHFLNEYKAGRTPNPDITCNKEIKFRAFLDYALDLNAEYIATGHYARCKISGPTILLKKSRDADKDQTYFLHTLNTNQLEKVLFPLGEMNKSEVRLLAKENNFDVHNKKDSTGICFIGERKFKDFLQTYIPSNPGKILSLSDEYIGEHDGVMFYTIGQRQGLGIGGKQSLPEDPWYVADKDITANNLYVVQGHDNKALFHSKIIAHDVHWIAGHPPLNFENIYAKIRYRQQEKPCQIHNANSESLLVTFDSPQWAVAPGQSIVFYQHDTCLGGGIITERLN